jgi:hypothetical protein
VPARCCRFHDVPVPIALSLVYGLPLLHVMCHYFVLLKMTPILCFYPRQIYFVCTGSTTVFLVKVRVDKFVDFVRQ